MNYKTLLALVLFYGFSVPMVAQPWNVFLPTDRTPDFYDYQQAFEKYWAPFDIRDGFYLNEHGEWQKAFGYNQFKRWEYEWEAKINPATGDFPQINNLAVYRHQTDIMALASADRQHSNGIWTSMGPANSPGGYSGLGRINCVAFHPSDDEVIYAGTPAGGLWKTTNHGVDWFPLSDQLPTLGVSNLVIVVDNGVETIYLSTGDKDAQNTWSIGVLKSTDGGFTWYTTGLQFNTADNIIITQLLADPDNPQRIFAATNVALFVTTDGGNSWHPITSSGVWDLQLHPFDSQILYVATPAGQVYKSDDGGLSWTLVLEVPGGTYTKLGVSPAAPDRVYAVMGNNANGLMGVYRSDDSGQTFNLVYNQKNLLGWECSGNDTGGQAFYDLVISPDPLDADNVFVGGVNTWQSADGGQNFTLVTHWYETCQGTAANVHADKHAIVWHPRTHALYEGNDGGLSVSYNNGINYNFLSSGMEISQLYDVSCSSSNSDFLLTGLQDNGSKGYYFGIWRDVLGGDGMLCYVLPSNDSLQLACRPNGSVYGSDVLWADGGNWLTASIPGGQPNGAWVTPYLPDPTIDTTIYVGYHELYRSVALGYVWEQLTQFGGDLLKTLAIAPSNNQVIYTGTDNILYASIDRGVTWNIITGTLPVESGIITGITVKYDDPATLWVTMGGYNATRVFESNDGGLTWVDISQGLPAIPASHIIQNHQNTTTTELYVAMDVGIYVRLGNNPWLPYFEGLPNVPVKRFDIYYDDANPENNRLRAATYGRGLWESPLYGGGVSIAERFDANYRIGPNPAGTSLHITFLSEGPHHLVLIDMLGRQVFQSRVTTPNYSLDLSALPPGYYNLSLTDSQGLRSSRTIVHQ
ncbi:MAG: T9SS type A sorting domain-containing protein [Bacteroidales bacterium]|nr:T9SS type A sorting domain-containing protein [Bacteroidales bacterium]